MTDEESANAIGCYLNGADILPFTLSLTPVSEEDLEERWKKIREAWEHTEHP